MSIASVKREIADYERRKRLATNLRKERKEYLNVLEDLLFEYKNMKNKIEEDIAERTALVESGQGIEKPLFEVYERYHEYMMERLRGEPGRTCQFNLEEIKDRLDIMINRLEAEIDEITAKINRYSSILSHLRWELRELRRED